MRQFVERKQTAMFQRIDELHIENFFTTNFISDAYLMVFLYFFMHHFLMLQISLFLLVIIILNISLTVVPNTQLEFGVLQVGPNYRFDRIV